MMFNSRPDKELMSSPTPSQLSSFSSSFNSTAQGNIALGQRSLTNSTFQRTVTPTSLNVNFPFALQQQQSQQVSPNSLFSSTNRNSSLALPSQGGINLLKRSNALGQTPGLLNIGNAAFSSMGLFSSRTPDVNLSSLESDFPTLGSRNSLPNQLSTRSYVGMVNKPLQDSTPEFQIQQEDFPALPGAQNPPSSSGTDISQKAANVAGYDQAVKDKPAIENKSSGQQRRGIQTHPDGSITEIPAGMVADQFGIVGLLAFIRVSETDPGLASLAHGIDLTTLGLNVNTMDNLYSTFQSPFADGPCRPQDIDFHVPPEYLINCAIRDRLAPIKLNRYQEDLLFFLFYTNGGDVLQLAAAAELYNRDWRYHKEERLWLTRAPGMEPVTKTSAYERGTYFFFDVQNWRKVPREFYLEYGKLEERPQLPETMYKPS